MSKSRAVDILHRFRLAEMPADLLALLEATADPVRIGTTRYLRYTLRGVPGRRADVIVAESLTQPDRPPTGLVFEVTDQRPHELPPAHSNLVFEVADKFGKFDGAGRRRYAIRPFRDRAAWSALPPATVRVVATDAALSILVVPEAGGTIHADIFDRLRSDLADYDLSSIPLWHARRYYTHLDYAAEVIPAARVWAEAAKAEGAGARWTLAEANRAASVMLYSLSRALGWRKLSQDEKRRLYLPENSPMWQRIDDLMPRYAALAGNPIGVGEATLRAAHGGMLSPDYDGETTHDEDEDEDDYA